MVYSYLPLPLEQLFDDSGVPLSGGQVHTYEPGTFVPVNTYLDPDGTVLNSNPIILDGGGRLSMYATGEVRVVVYDKDGNTIYDRLSRVLQDTTITHVNAGAFIKHTPLLGRINTKIEGSFLTDPRTTKVRVRMVGGGGGGGGCDPANYTGGGGGAGAYVEFWRTNITPNSNFALFYSLDAGSNRAGAGGKGQDGGGAYMSDNVISGEAFAAAGGGIGGGSHSPTGDGALTSSGGAGGQGSLLAHPNINGVIFGGAWGEDGVDPVVSNVPQRGGNGGSSVFGGAGRAGIGPDRGAGGKDAQSYGSGGGGAYGSLAFGGFGSPPFIWVDEYSEAINGDVVTGGGGGSGGSGSETLAALTVTGNAHVIGTLNVDSGLAANTLAASGFHAANATIDTLAVQNLTATGFAVQNGMTVGAGVTADSVNTNTATIGGLTVTGQLNYTGPAIGNALPRTGGIMTGQIVMPFDPTASMEVATKHYVDIAVTNATPGGNTTAYLPTSGGTMSGNLFLNTDPTTSVQAATKHYVDIAIANAIAPGGSTIPVSAVLTTGGTMTGALILGADPTTSLQAATKRYVDVNAVPMGGATMTGALILSGDPTTSLQAATKHYVDIAVANAGGGSGTPVSALLTTGGTMTGFLLLNADPTNSLGAATKHYVDNAILAAGISGGGGGGSTSGALLLTGGTMVGNLVLNSDPTTSLQAATKHYVDTVFAGVTQGGVPSNVLLSTGGTMTGLLVLSADPQNPLGAVTKQYADSRFLQFGGGTMTGPVILAADPTASMQAATKHYVDTALAGINQGGTPSTALLTTGGTMTGALLLAADPTATLQAATKHYVDVAIAGVQATLPGNALLTTGGTMTGTLLLNADPTANLAAATKQYVDTRISGTASLQISGGTMTGPLTLAGDPNTNLMAATKQYVDTKVSTVTATGALPLTGGTMTGFLVLNGNPTIGLGAATKQYVDAQISGVQGSGVTQAALDSVSATATNAQNLANSAVAASQAADNTAATAANTANAAAITANNVSAVANSAQSTANTALGIAQGSLHLAGGGVVNGGIYATNEIGAGMDSGFGQFRAIKGGKSVLLRNDGTDFYLLDGTNTNGGWTDHRPFQWNLNSGNVVINQNGGDTTVGGMLYGNRALHINYDGNHTVNPIGNTIPTGTGLYVGGTTQRTGFNQREFALIAGLESTMGRNGSDPQGADKVAIYGGIEALSNASSNIWGLNTVSTVGANQHDVYCYAYEADVNFLPNDAEDRTNNFNAAIIGVAVTGVTANNATKTAAFAVNENNNAWARGLWFVNPGIRYHGIEDASNSQNCFFVGGGSNHNTFLNAAAVDFNVAAQIMRKGTSNSVGWINADGSGNIVRQYVVGDNMFVGKGGSGLFSGASVAFAPEVDNAQALGTGPNRWQTIWSANGTIQTSDINEKTNIESIPNTLDFVMDVDPIKYNWTVGGKKWVTKKEKQLVQAKEKRIRTVQRHEMVDGKMTLRNVEEEYDELLYDAVPLHDEDGNPIVEELEKDMHRPACMHEKLSHVPRMVEQEVDVEELVEVPGKRTHWGFAAQHVKAAVEKHDLGDFGGHVVMEDGKEGLRPDQLIPVLWKATQEMNKKIIALEKELAGLSRKRRV